MDLRQLRYFVAIVEHGSLSKAATVLRVAQPALSLHVRNMEADFGKPLLLRSPQGVRATPAGEILFRDAQQIIAQFEATREEIRGHSGEPSGRVRVGMPSSVSPILAMPLLIETRRRFPAVRLQVAEAMSGFVLDWVQRDRVDIGLVYTPFSAEGLCSTKVLSDELLLIGSREPRDPEMPRPAAEDRIAFAEIAQLPLVLPGAGHGLRELIEARAGVAGVILRDVTESDSVGLTRALLATGAVYTLLPTSAAAGEIGMERLRTWRITETVVMPSVHLVHATGGKPLPPAVSSIASLCTSILAQPLPDQAWSPVPARHVPYGHRGSPVRSMALDPTARAERSFRHDGTDAP